MKMSTETGAGAACTFEALDPDTLFMLACDDEKDDDTYIYLKIDDDYDDPNSVVFERDTGTTDFVEIASDEAVRRLPSGYKLVVEQD